MILKLKFFGLGARNAYQASVKLFSHGKLVFDGMTYDGKICIDNLHDDLYFLEATFLNEKIKTPIYLSCDNYCFFFEHSYFSNRIITFTLLDYFYNLPIEEGELILWQK